MTEYKIKVIDNSYKVIYTDSQFIDLKNFDNLAQAFAYIEKKELSNKGKKELSEAQKKFAAAFPDKAIDCDIPGHIDIDKLIVGVNESEFFRTQKNITLKSCIKHFDKIIIGNYKDFSKSKTVENRNDFQKRNYTKEQLKAMFTSQPEYEL